MKIRWYFTEIYIDFKNGGRPPSWYCFLHIRDHPRSLCCWLQLPVKFHVNLIHKSEDIAIWFFRIFGLKCLFRPPKLGFGDFGPISVIIHHRDPQKVHPCVNPCLLSYQLKIRWRVWPGELTESVTDTHTDTHTHTHKYTQVNLYSVHSWHWTNNYNYERRWRLSGSTILIDCWNIDGMRRCCRSLLPLLLI